jgi:phosphoketolase
LQGGGQHHTPLELAILNQVDRFDPVIEVIERVPGRSIRGAFKKADAQRHQRQTQLRAHTRH